MKQVYCLIIGCLIYLTCFYLLAEEPEEKQRPRADFLQSRLNAMMQNTASWLDSTSDEESKNASANGYLQLSWLPRTADLDDLDAKFKVFLHLPKWNERFSLIIDNDDESERLLDYESDYTNVNQESINIAIQHRKRIHKKNQIKNRVGISRRQLYLRSEINFDGKLGKTEWSLQPRIDYFLKDGWGPSVKGIIDYKLEKNYFSLSASWQKIQSEARSRRKVGFFHVMPTGKNQLLVSGIQYNKSNNKQDISNESYFISTRYRNLVYKSWMYFEVEPFVEFDQKNNFRREVGIALSITSYYGSPK